MKRSEINKALKEGRKIAEQLLKSAPLYFRDLTPSDLPEKMPGVYAIFDEDHHKVLYVGRTKNLRRRLYTNHLHGPKTNARLMKYLVEEDTLLRGRIEGLLSYLLNVRYIHEEHRYSTLPYN